MNRGRGARGRLVRVRSVLTVSCAVLLLMVWEARGLACPRFGGGLLFEPEAVRTKAGDPFRVFTPFYRACLAQWEGRAIPPWMQDGGHECFAWERLLALGLPAARLPATSHLQVNEALVIVALAFVLTPLLMSYPLTATGLTPGDALFEAVSGITTTGLSTIEHIADRSPALWFARAWMQWYGGLGIVVLSVGLLMGHQSAARRLVEPFSPETLASTARTFARRMLLVYTLLTVAGIAILSVLCGDAFMATIHVLSAVSTGGFSPYQDSLASFGGWPLRYAVIAIAVAAAVPLSLYQRAWQHGWRTLAADVELRALLLCGLLVAGLLALFMDNGHDKLNHALLLGFSAQTTAGFATLNVGALDNASKLVLIAAMAIGGGLGSTAGEHDLEWPGTDQPGRFLASFFEGVLRRPGGRMRARGIAEDSVGVRLHGIPDSGTHRCSSGMVEVHRSIVS